MESKKSNYYSSFLTRVLIAFFITIGIYSGVIAQKLEFLPPIINPDAQSRTKLKNDTSSLIVGTKCNIDYSNRSESSIKIFANSLQIINAGESWPPVWYYSEPPYTHELYAEDSVKKRIGMSILGGSPIMAGSFIYFKLAPSANIDTTQSLEWQFDWIYTVLDKGMNQVDVLKSRTIYGGSYGPDFRKNNKIEQLTFARKDSVLDLSSITGNPNHRAVKSVFWVLQVLDQNDNLKYEWNPIFHLSPELFQIKEKLAAHAAKPDDKISWLKIEQFWWDQDGNILYSGQDDEGRVPDLSFNAGVGKVSRADGHVIWHLDCFGKPLTFGKDTLECFYPCGIKSVEENDTSFVYSFFERGSGILGPARGAVLEQIKKTSKLKLVKYVKSKNTILGNSEGGFDYETQTGNFILDYGVLENSDTATTPFHNTFEYGIRDSTVAIFQLPRKHYVAGMGQLKNWPVPVRPQIQKKGNQLIAVGEMKVWTWYKLEGPNNTVVKEVGKGSSIIPEAGSKYCVAGALGIGYSVSKVFEVRKNVPY